jgi:uncharacterized protein YqjF (DUF2071 family)
MILNHTAGTSGIAQSTGKMPPLLCVPKTATLSHAARSRLLFRRGEPLLVADWDRALMLHFEVDAKRLQQAVPFELDLWDRTHAFVSVVAFTLHGMRLRAGGWLGAWLLKPLATHEFLNVRTYVLNGEERGIHFLAEWLPNPLAVLFGPITFGLPYRLGRLEYRHRHESGDIRGIVEDARSGASLQYAARLADDACFAPCHAGSLDEWLMERYTAFNAAQGRRRFFRVWHEPWPQTRAESHLEDGSLLTEHWPFFHNAQLVGSNYSPGVRGVWMGRPHRIREKLAAERKPYELRHRRTAQASLASSKGF